MSGLSGPTSQFLNGMHEFSELVVARMVLLMDQSRSVLSLCSAKVREFGVVHGGNICMCAPFLGQNKQVETDLRKPRIYDKVYEYTPAG